MTDDTVCNDAAMLGLRFPPGNLLIFRWWLAVAVILLCSSCTWIVAPPVDDPAASQQVERLRRQNESLRRAKGILRVNVEGLDETVSGKAAWAIQMPDRLRIEWLNMLGQPLFSLAGDGETLAMRSYADGRLHRMQQTSGILEKFLQVPLSIDELNTLIAGRLPLPPYTGAQFVGADGAEQAILLKSRWHKTAAKLYVGEDRMPSKMERYGLDGELRYRVLWYRWSFTDGYRIARQFEIISEKGERVRLSLERFWPDVVLPADIFTLKHAP